MRLTPALSVRQLLAKLHPPLPRSVRESRQLLNVLETSFRKHLDEAHPSPTHSVNDETTQRVIPLNSADSSSNATQHYLHSLLTHPLLDAKAAAGLSQVPHTKNAIEQYQLAFARGKITINVLKACIKEYCVGIRNHETVIKQDRLGSRLAAWMYSADCHMKEAFFLTPNVLDGALAVMAIDNEERTVWDWLRMVYERDLGYGESSTPALSDPKWLAVEDGLVSTLMRFSIRRRNLDDAAHQFAEACQYRLESGRTAARAHRTSLTQSSIPMISSWKRLAASIMLTRSEHGISPTHYDLALQHSLAWTEHALFNEALLSIYHPSAASAQLLAMNLRNSLSRDAFAKAIQKLNKNMAAATLVTLLDGAQLSLDHNIPSDAQLLLDFVGAGFREYLPAAEVAQQANIQDRLRSMWEAVRDPKQRAGYLEFT